MRARTCERHLLIHSGTDQSLLEQALTNDISRETFDNGLEYIRNRARDQILQSMKQNDVDVILGPSDGRMASVAACAGYPIATVPLGFADFNGRAFGMNVLAPANEEGAIFRLMSAWEGTFPDARAPPPLLANWNDQATPGPQP